MALTLALAEAVVERLHNFMDDCVERRESFSCWENTGTIATIAQSPDEKDDWHYDFSWLFAAFLSAAVMVCGSALGLMPNRSKSFVAA